MIDPAHTRQFDAAVQMVKEGRLQEAITVLKGILNNSISGDERLRAACWKYLGDIHLHLLDDAQKAETHYRQALAHFPRAEHASLGLFHSLIGQQRVNEALEEARRLLTLRSSTEYKRLLKEIDSGEDPLDQ